MNKSSMRKSSETCELSSPNSGSLVKSTRAGLDPTELSRHIGSATLAWFRTQTVIRRSHRAVQFPGMKSSMEEEQGSGMLQQQNGPAGLSGRNSKLN